MSCCSGSKLHFDDDLVHLFSFPRTTAALTLSPACLKVEAFLRAKSIPHRIHFTGDASVSPTGRMPFIVHRNVPVADSEFIIRHLRRVLHIEPTLEEAALTAVQLGTSTALRKLVTESIRLHYGRYFIVDNPTVGQRLVNPLLPGPPFVKSLLFQRVFRKNNIDMLNAQGHGDLTNDEYLLEFEEDIKALEALLGQSTFAVTNDTPTDVDFTIFGAMEGWFAFTNADKTGPDGKSITLTPAMKLISESPVLTTYRTRLMQMLFPDRETLISPGCTTRNTELYDKSGKGVLEA